MACQAIDFTIRRGDLFPAITATRKDTIGGVATVVNLTGCTVQFVYKPVQGGASVIRTAAIVGAATLGQVKYQWITADTSVAGDYFAYWKVTYADATIGTYPNANYNLFVVAESL